MCSRQHASNIWSSKTILDNVIWNQKESRGLISRKTIDKIDDLLKNIKSPHQVSKLTRPFSERQYWKASEWENWNLFYSVLPPEFLMHWILFVEAIHILSREEIQTTELDLADYLLHKFVVDTEKLYSKWAMTFNVHLLLHLTKSVHDWGPLRVHNAYAFESENGKLLKSTHCAKGIHHQICRRISLKYCMLLLMKRVNFSFSVKHFCTHICSTMVQKSLKYSESRYFGPHSITNTSWVEKLNMFGEQTFCYMKMVKNRCLFMSSAKINSRSNNTYAQLNDKSYVKLISFLVDRANKLEFTIVKKIKTITAVKEFHTFQMLQKIEEISHDDFAIPTSSIDKVCIVVNVNEKDYICSVNNLKCY